jgi:uncharacterized protein (TIGR03083 family)
VAETNEHDLAGLYRDCRQRLTGLVADLDGAAWEAEVAACPGWKVRDVVAHLVAIPEDAIAGRLTGIPDEEFTADQVARMAEVPVPELLERWSAAAPRFEEIVAALGIWPAVIDAASHEQDIRGAVGQPGARDCRVIRSATPLLLSMLSPSVPVTIVTEDGEQRVGIGDQGDDDGPGRRAGLTLSTSRYEAFRWRMGRRSRSQLAAMDWSGDPSPVLGQLAIFGPADADVIE